MALGAPSVMISGTTEMPVWCADNWDTPHMVQECRHYELTNEIPINCRCCLHDPGEMLSLAEWTTFDIGSLVWAVSIGLMWLSKLHMIDHVYVQVSTI